MEKECIWTKAKFCFLENTTNLVTSQNLNHLVTSAQIPSAVEVNQACQTLPQWEQLVRTHWCWFSEHVWNLLLYCKNLNSHCEIEQRTQDDLGVRILAMGFLTNEMLLLINARDLILIMKVGLRGLLVKNCRYKSVKRMLNKKPVMG